MASRHGRWMVRARRSAGAVLLAATLGSAVAAPVFGLSGGAVSVGQSLFVTATATDLSDLYGYQFSLHFDPTRLRFVAAQEGSFLAASGATFFDGGTVDNVAGSVGLVFDTLIGPGAGASGGGDLARFEFTTLQPGPTSFSLSDVLAVDSTLATIPVGSAATSVAIPEPATLAVVLLGLLIMASVRGRAAAPGRSGGNRSPVARFGTDATKERRTSAWSPATRSRAALAAVVALIASAGATPAIADSTPAPHWVGTWTASVEPNARTNLPGFANQTLRFVLRSTIGGSTARIQLSNVFGATPLRIGSAHLALHATGAAIVPGSDRVLTFNGSTTASVPARGVLYSDPVALDIPEIADVAITLYLPGPAVATVTGHSFSMTTNYTSPAGDYSGAVDMPVGNTACFQIAPRPCITPWYYITRLEVVAPAETSAIVTLGDSITDGDSGGSPVNEIDQYYRWPSILAGRLLAQKGSPDIAVLNAGISGNNLRGSNGALDRLDRDVLSQSGVKYVILLEGINDASAGMIASQLIAIDQQIVDRVHSAGLKIYGATLTPAGSLPGTVREYNRAALSDWIRTSGAFDGVIDFDRLMAYPGKPTFMVPAYDSGDHTHPSPVGYGFMGHAIDIGFFKGRDGPYPWSGVHADVDGDGVITCNDLVATRATMGKRLGALGYAATADVDGNGIVDIRDLSAVARALPAGTHC